MRTTWRHAARSMVRLAPRAILTDLRSPTLPFLDSQVRFHASVRAGTNGAGPP